MNLVLALLVAIVALSVLDWIVELYQILSTKELRKELREDYIQNHFFPRDLLLCDEEHGYYSEHY